MTGGSPISGSPPFERDWLGTTGPAIPWASIPCPKSWCYHRGCSRPSRLDTPRSPCRSGGSQGRFAWNVQLPKRRWRILENFGWVQEVTSLINVIQQTNSIVVLAAPPGSSSRPWSTATTCDRCWDAVGVKNIGNLQLWQSAGPPACLVDLACS